MKYCADILLYKYVESNKGQESMFGELATKNLYTAQISDNQNEMLENSRALQLNNKYSASEISDIELAATSETELIRNEIDGLEGDDRTGQAYVDLMGEIKEIQDETDRKLKRIETETSDFQTQIEMENSLLETQNEAMKADLEAIDQALEDSIENNFGYFQN